MKLQQIFMLYCLILLLMSCSKSNYTRYLSNNMQVMRQTEQGLVLNNFDKDFYSNQLFMVGEIHEVATSPLLDVAIFEKLNLDLGISVYIGELDIAQSYFLNEYIKGSNEFGLQYILKDWVVGIGQHSKEVRDKFEKLRNIYAQVPEDKKFEIVGIEMNTDFDLIKEILIRKLNIDAIDLYMDDSEFVVWCKKNLPVYLENKKDQISEDDLYLISNILFNFEQYHENWYWYRDKYSFLNFKRLHIQRNWKDKKLYACYGFAHTLQGFPFTLAGRIKKDTILGFYDKIVSLNALYVDSYLTVSSASLPKLIRSKDKFSKLGLSYDNLLFMYVKGIQDYKKVTTKNSITLFKLNGENSPYTNSLRGTQNFALLPLWDGFKIEDKNSVTTDYAQYVIFVRNADGVLTDK